MNNKIKEDKLSAVGFMLAKAYLSDKDVPFELTDISIKELRSLEKRFDFSVFVKAYLHNLKAKNEYKYELLSLNEAVATVLLSGMVVNGRSREALIELLSMINLNDVHSFLEKYENLHGGCWLTEAAQNE